MIDAADDREVQRLALKVRGLLFMLQSPAGIMRQIAEGLEFQTRTRIHLEKTDPDGNPWRPWSRRYAATRRPPDHSLLKDTWALVDGLQHESTGSSATVFSTRPYAGHVQKTRPFLGLSEQNAADLEAWLGPAIDHLTAEAFA